MHAVWACHEKIKNRKATLQFFLFLIDNAIIQIPNLQNSCSKAKIHIRTIILKNLTYTKFCIFCKCHFLFAIVDTDLSLMSYRRNRSADRPPPQKLQNTIYR